MLVTAQLKFCVSNYRQGSTKAWTGLVRVDGKSYIYLGNPLEGGQRMAEHAKQTGTATTPTQTHFYITAGPVDLTVTFFSPVEIHDIPRQSIPLSYALLSVVSNDGQSHEVEAYMDISGKSLSKRGSRKASVYRPNLTY